MHDSDEDDKSPTEEEEAQDSPGPAVTPKEFDSDVSSNLFAEVVLGKLRELTPML